MEGQSSECSARFRTVPACLTPFGQTCGIRAKGGMSNGRGFSGMAGADTFRLRPGILRTLPPSGPFFLRKAGAAFSGGIADVRPFLAAVPFLSCPQHGVSALSQLEKPRCGTPASYICAARLSAYPRRHRPHPRKSMSSGSGTPPEQSHPAGCKKKSAFHRESALFGAFAYCTYSAGAASAAGAAASGAAAACSGSAAAGAAGSAAGAGAAASEAAGAAGAGAAAGT